jgi:GT2 family glycosyltransferase
VDRVDAVIVTYGSEATVASAIGAVRRWPRCGRVIVVDNASTDRSVTVAGAGADAVIERPSNIGFGAAQNEGIRQATTPLVLLLNPDAVVDPEGLERGWQVLERDPAVAMVEGRIVRAVDGRDERWCGQEPGLRALVARLLRLRERLGEQRLRRAARVVGARDYAQRRVDADRDVDFLAAVAPLVRRAAFDAVGGFDERIFLYGEDVELCHRLIAGGWRLRALASPWARHVGGASSSGREGTRDRLWWASHRVLVETTWRGPRRTAGRLVTSLGARQAARRAPEAAT